jgi:hypothetical protein
MAIAFSSGALFIPKHADVNHTGDIERSVAIFSHVRDFSILAATIKSDITSLFIAFYLMLLVSQESAAAFIFLITRDKGGEIKLN